MPPMSAMNQLHLIPIEDPLLHLTELEGALIAKHLIFEKIIQLPKSRWTALKDKIVNIPIKDNDILNTIEQMPRMPKEAGLIGVELKRKKEYKNTHKQQLINPEKLYKMLDTLKRAGNPYYQFYDDYNTFKEKCQSNDPAGHEIIFKSIEDTHDDLHEDLHPADYCNLQDNINDESNSCIDSDDSNDQEEKEEKEYITKDAVKKWQFDYNKSLCLSNKYPEISSNSENDIPIISVAPGEGKTPSNMMNEKDWDIKAFPHLHNPDATNGKDQEREVRITDQYYFIQRICNEDSRFAKSPAYIYAAIAYLEKKQLQRNINISFTHGKEVKTSDGETELRLDDGYAVLDDISGTPKYWKKYKYEFLAKLDNLGPFQFFFTLSCADMRWHENFAAILREKGYTVHYSIIPEGDTFNTIIEVDTQNGKKSLANFLKEDVDSSLHEFIRNNVLLATRFFQHRVQAFIREVMLGKNNPMNIKYYSYKVEFQDRGAGHIHGVLWINMKVLERLIRTPQGELIDPAEQKSKEVNIDTHKESIRPFKNLSRAFKKIRNEEILNNEDKETLKNFVNEFITCSLNPATVGEDVVKLASEVNRHHHTKTCRKYQQVILQAEKNLCRFGYRKFPSPFTIIVVPCKLAGESRAKKFERRAEILDIVREILNDDDIIKEIMTEYDKNTETKDEYKTNRELRIKEVLKIAGVSLTEYIDALSYSRTGYSVVLERDIDETDINFYNIEMLRAWNANMDIQICLDFYAIITYITEYIAKLDAALMEVLKSVLQKNTDLSNNEKMALVANTFQTHRQIGEAEAFYKLIPSLKLKDSNVTTQWLSIGDPNEVTKRLKQATEEDIASGFPLITLKDREGFYYLTPDMMSKYLRRDPIIENVVSVHFAKMFQGGMRTDKKNQDEDANQEDPLPNKEDDDVNDDDDAKFHYIITPETALPNCQKEPLPDVVSLQWTYPKEPKYMKKRRFPAVLRYHKINKNNNPEKYMLHELMMYKPFRDISELQKDTLKQYEEREPTTGKRRIDLVKEQVMQHLESVEEARFNLEQAQLNVDMEKMGILLDPTLEQENADCLLEGTEDCPEYFALDPEDLEIAEEESSHTHKSTYRSFEISDENTLRQRSRELDPDQRIILDIAIKYAKDIVKAREKEGNIPPHPPTIIGHGGAGAGKSTVINILAEWCQLILLKPGDNLDCPYIIKCAFTGTAAANIQGQTLHSAFGFSFDNTHYSLSDKIRDKKRAQLKNLKIVIIDEISMVKADMLYMLDLRLQEITEKINSPFGGVALFTFGDIMQLRPCQGRYIFDIPSNPDFHVTHLLQSRWKMLQVINLRTNHRQGKDKTYADLLNRIRTGSQTPDDLEVLSQRIRPKDHEDLTKAELFICCTRKKVAKHNETYLTTLPGELYEFKATNHLATQKNFKPKIHLEGTIGITSFMNQLKLKLGTKVILIHNINTADCLTNGQLGILIGLIKSDNEHTDKLVIKFNNENAGKESRQKHPGITAKYIGGTIIERVSFTYPISKKSTEASTMATLIQFPIKLAHSITTHKIQGSTIPKPSIVALDIESCFEPAQAYVMLSRVQELSQIIILEKLTASKLNPNIRAKSELQSMNERSLQENATNWNKKDTDSLKLASLNIRGLKGHIEDLRCDQRMQQADIIHLQETSTKEDECSNLCLNNFRSHFINIGQGKGIASYYSNKFEHVQDIATDNFQITKFSSEKVDSINVYRSQRGLQANLNDYLTQLLSKDKITVITGDFNICSRIKWNNSVTTHLKSLGCKQYQLGATHIQGGHIDHLYIKHDGPRSVKVEADRYSPYYSDHDGILTILTPKS